MSPSKRFTVVLLVLVVMAAAMECGGFSFNDLVAQEPPTPFSKELIISPDKFVVDGWHRIITGGGESLPYTMAVGLTSIWVEFEGEPKKVYAPTLLSKDGGNISDPHPLDGLRIVTVLRIECGIEQVYLLTLRFHADGINGLYFYMAARNVPSIMNNVPQLPPSPLCP